MFTRFRIACSFALLIAIVLVVPAFAGGWAVITLDELPFNIAAGEPLTVGFTVLQHGRTPMTDLDPTVTASSGSETFVVHAKAEGKPGHYAATLTFPAQGNWKWSIQAFSMDQAMPDLSVSAPAVAVVGQTAAKSGSISPLFIVPILALIIGLAGVVVAFQRKSRLAAALTVICLLVGLASFVTGSGLPLRVEAQSKSSSETFANLSIPLVEFGRQLFIAKGCITCHVNTRASLGSEHWTIDMGATNLSAFSASPEALRLRLKDPSSVKSDTKMPNLNLSDVEIEALIAFINSK